MKVIKKMTAVLAITGLLFVSCDKAKEKNEDFKVMKIELADGNTVNYKMSTDGSLSFDDWDGFNTANNELREIENLDLETSTARIENLSGSIASLRGTIPSWLKNEEVMEDIDDIEEEYKKLLAEKNEPAKNVKQNLEELIEKFDDLREELQETIDKYKS